MTWLVLSVKYILNQYHVIMVIFPSISDRPMYPVQVCKSIFVLHFFFSFFMPSRVVSFCIHIYSLILAGMCHCENLMLESAEQES